MPTPHLPEYAMVTVKLDAADSALHVRQQFEKIKTSLGIASPDIDENYGFIPMRNPQGVVTDGVVLIEKNVADALKASGHPSVIGVFSNPKFETFDGSMSMGFGGMCQTKPNKQKSGPKR